jgi:hypothetical protein
MVSGTIASENPRQADNYHFGQCLYPQVKDRKKVSPETPANTFVLLAHILSGVQSG